MPQPFGLLSLAGDGGNFVTELGEDRDCNAANTARRPGDEHRPAIGLDAAVDNGGYRLSRGEAGRPIDHRVAER